MQVSSVVAIGMVEGITHVNWKLLFTMLLWWGLGFFLIIAFTAACAAQGQLLIWILLFCSAQLCSSGDTQQVQHHSKF